MNVLIACEFSGLVRDAFRARGHDAVSCDLEPTERPGPHVQCDAREAVDGEWDMLIAFPPCTYLCNSGVRWLHERPERWAQMHEACRLFLALLNADAPRVAVENPVMHRYAREIIGRGPDFTIQPWQFGHGEIKRTCFWTRGLPPLVPTEIVEGRAPRVHHASPGPNRGRDRSRTLAGIAEAMADQWGSVDVLEAS